MIKDLVAKTVWLEHHVRVAGDLDPADLDDVNSDLRQLARKARAALHAKSRLLSELDRQHLSCRVDNYTNISSELNKLVDQALKHSKTLADTVPSDQAHTEAASLFRTAHSSAASKSQQVQNLKENYIKAKAELAADDHNRETLGAQIMAGEKADAKLRALLRKLITTHVMKRALLPVWFTTQLGYGPPSDRTAEWLDAATDLLAYRITYEINDPVIALGPQARDRLE